MVGKVWELSRGKVSSFPEVDADRPRLVCRQDLVLPYEIQSRSTSKVPHTSRQAAQACLTLRAPKKKAAYTSFQS